MAAGAFCFCYKLIISGSSRTLKWLLILCLQGSILYPPVRYVAPYEEEKMTRKYSYTQEGFELNIPVSLLTKQYTLSIRSR